MITTKKTASMLTTGKILEDSLMFTTTEKSFAQIGKLKTSLDLIPMAAKTNIDANLVMAGKNNSIIQETTKFILVNSMVNVRNCIVRIFTLKKIEDSLLIQTSSCFLKTVEASTVN